MAASQEARLKLWREQDFYAVLGVARGASAMEVKRGFRRVALTCHPDKVRDEDREEATKRFQLIAEAYNVLADAKLRRRYDAERRICITASDPRPNREVRARPADLTSNVAGAHDFLQCTGCKNRCLRLDLRRCPGCAKMVCVSCKMCADCKSIIPTTAVTPLKKQPEPAPTSPRPWWAGGPASPDQQEDENRMPPPLRKVPGAGYFAGTGLAHSRAWTPPFPPSPSRATRTTFHTPRSPTPDPAAESPPSPSPCFSPLRPSQAEEASDEVQDGEKVPPPMDSLNILLTMGFKEPDAREAVETHSTLEAALEHLMLSAHRARAEAGAAFAAVAETASAIMKVGERVGEHLQSWWGGAGKLNEEPRYFFPKGCAVEYHSRSTDSWIHARVQSFDLATNTYCLEVHPQAPVERVRLRREMLEKPGLVPELLEQGFSEEQASLAAHHCSSLEAALNWLEVGN
eukprot:TRINITY_DN94793_c0_g1_i1.p1 TRINITY_DN94793_c0_g1~~TRINITY_DN94793_c0_g1_i1.p1  ORF type:complete len:469 (+),score=69.83 TRINITY_DN94793_c0_g1_i1:31-1407(+)